MRKLILTAAASTFALPVLALVWSANAADKGASAPGSAMPASCGTKNGPNLQNQRVGDAALGSQPGSTMARPRDAGIAEDGRVRSAGRIATSREQLELFAQSLGPDDHVALEAGSSTREIVRILEPHVARVVADLFDHIRGAPALNIDETGWRLKGAQRALWVAFTKRHAVFAIAANRHEDHARNLLADTPRRS